MKTEQNERNTLKYYGWSTVLLGSDKGGELVFDPFYSSSYGTYWSELRDFDAVKVICLTHGHFEHYSDAHKVASRTGATIVAAPRLCEHLASHYRVPKAQLNPIKPGETAIVNGYEITEFTWYHRNINYFKFFGGKIWPALHFVLNNFFHTPLDTPMSGFIVRTPEGLTLMNLTEGMNGKMPIAELEALAKRHVPDVLLGGWQLFFEDAVAACVKGSGAPKCVLYHPHSALFDLMNFTSTPLEVFCEKIKELSPNVEILTPEPRGIVAL